MILKISSAASSFSPFRYLEEVLIDALMCSIDVGDNSPYDWGKQYPAKLKRENYLLDD